MQQRATFKNMQDSTAADWQIIATEFGSFAKALPDRIITHLKLLEGDFGGFAVDRYTHSLQTATRAMRDGRDEEYIVCALLHDMGDTLGTFNHADIAAAVLKPFVSEANYWMIEHHGIFQGYHFFHHVGLNRHLRDNFAGHPHYAYTAEFCERYDSPAFDINGETLPLSAFEPMLRRVLSSPRQTIYAAEEAG